MVNEIVKLGEDACELFQSNDELSYLTITVMPSDVCGKTRLTVRTQKLDGHRESYSSDWGDE